MKNFTVKDLTLNAIFGSIYVVLVFIFSILSFDDIQFRIAEVLLIFALFNPKIIPGLILGNFIANLGSPLGIIDSVIGSIASLIALILMVVFKNKPKIAMIFPAISNGLIVGAMLHIMLDLPLIITMFFVFLGEAVVMYLLGLPLYYYVKKNDHILDLIS